MKKTILLLAFTGALFYSAYAQPDTGLNSKFDKVMREHYPLNETGATVLVSSRGKIIYLKAFGLANAELNVPMQAHNVFRIASITKQFTAVAILQLMEQGKLDLQDEITRFMPDYPTRGQKITIEHLLTHTSGITDYSALRDTLRPQGDLTPVQMITIFQNLPMRFASGTKWEYSNSGYFLLGYIIEKITGKPYAQYLEDHIFKPLAMAQSHYASDIKLTKNRASGYTFGENGYENAPYLSMTHPYAAGSIQSTVEDMFKWQQAILTYKLVKKESLDKAFTRYRLADGKQTAYGYGWRIGKVYESPTLWHGGLIAGYTSMALYLPKEDVYVVVFSNCDCSSPEVATTKIAALAAGRAYEYKEIAVSDKILHGYTGVYENEKNQQHIITMSKNKLFLQLGRGPKSLIKSYEKDKFFYEADAMSTIEFEINRHGAVEKLNTISLRGTDNWIKTNKPIPDEKGIKVADQILESYTGEYEVSPDFTFLVSNIHGRLYLQATGQEKLEMFAETPTTFFLKVNDAQLEFVKDATGKVSKTILKQGGRETEARKIK